jgi:hypothetical protein
MLLKLIDIGIPNGLAEEGTRGLPKAHDPKDKKDLEAQLVS